MVTMDLNFNTWYWQSGITESNVYQKHANIL